MLNAYIPEASFVIGALRYRGSSAKDPRSMKMRISVTSAPAPRFYSLQQHHHRSGRDSRRKMASARIIGVISTLVAALSAGALLGLGGHQSKPSQETAPSAQLLGDHLPPARSSPAVIPRQTGRNCLRDSSNYVLEPGSQRKDLAAKSTPRLTATRVKCRKARANFRQIQVSIWGRKDLRQRHPAGARNCVAH